MSSFDPNKHDRGRDGKFVQMVRAENATVELEDINPTKIHATDQDLIEHEIVPALGDHAGYFDPEKIYRHLDENGHIVRTDQGLMLDDDEPAFNAALEAGLIRRDE